MAAKGGGRGGGRKKGKGKVEGTGPSLKEAQKLQQKAEKAGSRGWYSQDAVQLYRRATEAYLELYRTLKGNQQQEALVGLAECYGYVAELKVASCRGLTHVSQERDVKNEVCYLCKQSAECYSKILAAPDVEHREEIYVNLGNSLCVWAENADMPESLSLFKQALEQYDQSLGLRPDADTYMNKGDLLQRLAEVFLDAGDEPKAKAAFQEANAAYDLCCQNTDTTKGDDLVGLLESWGANLLSVAGVLSVGEEREACLQGALAKLNGAISFDVTATKAMNTIGDIYVLLSENAALATDQRLKFLEDALNLGYKRTLSVNRNDLDAAVGVAETQYAMGKLCSTQGETANASQMYLASAQRYGSVLSDPKLWNDFGDVHERSNFLYNAAVAMSSVGGDAALAEAVQTIKACVSFGVINPMEILSDSDLASIHSRLQSASA